MAKIISLTAHKNTRAQRERREIRQHMLGAARELGRTEHLSGYALVRWTSRDGRQIDSAKCHYWPGSTLLHTNLMPELVKTTLARAMAMDDAATVFNENVFGPEDDA